MLKTLPSKYYLQHFKEFLRFVAGPCLPLLDAVDQGFLDKFKQLDEAAQCLFVRALNRKSPLIRRQSLWYEEICDHQHHLDTLIEQGFYRHCEARDQQMLVASLSKPELCQLLNAAGGQYSKAAAKASLLEQAKTQCDFNHIKGSGLDGHFIIRAFQPQTDYFLFLFFGDLHSGLNKFSMRDLGVMRTKRGVSNDVARFDEQEQAKSAFFYALKLHQFDKPNAQDLLRLGSELHKLVRPSGCMAETYREQYLFALGKGLLAINRQLALSALALSGGADAQEKSLRERYKDGSKAQVKEELEQIIEEGNSQSLVAFAEDFLARKFQQKRTSAMTDLLREKPQPILIDEMYMNAVEVGVQRYYQKQGMQVFRTENRLWRALFALTFWQELFELDNKSMITEFDYKPQTITQNTFYQDHAEQIEQRLATLNSSKNAFKQLSQTILAHYGQQNGLFRWHRSLLQVFAVFFEHVCIEAVIEQLRCMAKDYNRFSDGYPDLMVVDEEGLRFDEVKAPGDQLRKNQLLSIQQLRKNQFKVEVTQVSWFLDPQQPYAVVDIETTGGRGNSHRITEIGIVIVIGETVVDSWQTLINPQRHIPKSITALTGIDNAMVANAPLFSEITETLRSVLNGCVFVAHNVNFDYGFIRNEFERLQQHFSMPKLCTVREMRKARPGLKSYSLANLTQHFGIDMSRHHRALSDAQAAAELLFIINHTRLQNQGS